MSKKHAFAAVAALALAVTAGGGIAVAAPTTARSVAPSACRPANHTATIAAAPASSGHSHYRVTLTAARGYESCVLAGSPTGVRFSNHGKQTGVAAGHYGDQKTKVTFGPGHPVHFDIQVPDMHRGTASDEASFTLQAPGGEIPGTSFAEGKFSVASGTLIGPVQRGA
ncbi:MULTISPECIES: DUF4232 domain-containing protein [Streptomyces]|uniref:DUF4232 domain-containing protein n=1 Tax=Streptomyces TaxID=1883 RepID=UPI00109CA454|nr:MULTISPECIES: DUF4232 domain-containing protein [unclassified Streptomyces]MCE3035342.1 DUF4232 domain-containing protein [Streptomyces sp. CMSTAAHL-2]TGZ15333.1 hypothetical protein DV517_03060 [Streptomyces sp. S816]